MVFKAKILFLVAFVCCNSLASLTISIDNGDRTWFTVGERAFVSVYIEETGALLDSSSTYSSTYKWGTKPYVLKNESGNALWLESVGRPEFDSNLNTDDDSAHWQNNQIFWLELSGIASTTKRSGNSSDRYRDCDQSFPASTRQSNRKTLSAKAGRSVCFLCETA